MNVPACPACDLTLVNPGHKFCTGCGLVLKQPCPHCSAELWTPRSAFITCRSCEHDFWSCQSCGRLYHLDRTACQNNYCPQQDTFWTIRFGDEQFHQQPQERLIKLEDALGESPKPAWIGGATAGSDIRWPSLHAMGLILTVQEAGVVELWAERGAPHQIEGNDFREKSVCLNRLDLGEDSPTKPFFWRGHFRIPGASSLSSFELNSSPSIGSRFPLDELGKPRHFAFLRRNLLVWGEEALGELADDGHLTVHHQVGAGVRSFLVTDGKSEAILIREDEPPLRWSSSEPQELREMTGDYPDQVDYALYADGFVMVAGNELFFEDKGAFRSTELPASVVAQPLYNTENKRLTLLLNEGSARTCSTSGEKFSFLCDLAGTPSTVPLLLGEHLLYGTEGRYLCYDSEAVRPRLPSPPMGALSYANGRVFGTLRDGSMFCFEL